MPLIRHGADRAILVSNAPSLVQGSAPPTDALALLERYIDISVNGAGADGVSLATSFAEVRRASEQLTCLDWFDPKKCTAPPCSTFCAVATSSTFAKPQAAKAQQ